MSDSHVSTRPGADPLTGLTKEEANGFRNWVNDPAGAHFFEWMLRQLRFLDAVDMPEQLGAQGFGFDLWEKLCRIDPQLASDFMRDHFIYKQSSLKVKQPESEETRDDG